MELSEREENERNFEIQINVSSQERFISRRFLSNLKWIRSFMLLYLFQLETFSVDSLLRNMGTFAHLGALHHFFNRS